MTTTEHDPTIELVAARLHAALVNGTPIEPVRTSLSDIDAAYQVQSINTARILAEGNRLVGRKIGLTSPAVQAQLGVDQPDFGALFESMRLPSGATMAFGAVCQPRVEAEVALELQADLDDPELQEADVVAATSALYPAIEIVGSRISNWDIDVRDTIADNASSGKFVLGTDPVDPNGIDLAAVTMTMSVDGSEASTGSGAACLGSPYRAALWLARRMIAVGTPLRSGDIVMTGALGPMVDFAPGTVVDATISQLGNVQIGREDDDS